MNCCWIFLLLLCCGGSGCGSAASRTSNNNCCQGRRESRNAGSMERENGCGCEAVRSGTRREEAESRREEARSRREDRDGCDIASTIPQPWQEYARRDAEECQD